MSMSQQPADAPAPAVRLEPAVTSRIEKKVPRKLRRILSLDDFEKAAERHLPRSIFGYVSGATETGASFSANRRSFADLAFVPRVLRDVSGRSQKTMLLGREYEHPFGISPMGLSALAAYDGDVVLAAGARECGIPAVMSATSLTKLERVASEGGSHWFQAYLPGDDARIEAMIDRVAPAGFETFVLTVDVPVAGNRENNIRNGFDAPLKPSPRLAWQGITRPQWLFGTALRTLVSHGMPHFENMDALRGPPIVSRNVVRSMEGRDRLSWKHAELIRKRWKGNFVVKGILAPEDARIARETGCDGIVVSNHGGRQLDGALSPLEALPGIVPQTGNMAVIVESGIRRGTDVLKALALGADFVFIGRPFLFAAAIAGQAGVRHGVDLLAAEIDRNMTLLGIQRPDQMTPDLLYPAPFSGQVTPTS
jgi:L-lactate dehydrogenase (cytochrome)